MVFRPLMTIRTLCFLDHGIEVPIVEGKSAGYGAAETQSWSFFEGLKKDFCSKQIVVKVFSTLNAYLNSNNRPGSITI